MFEDCETGRTMDKATFAKKAAKLRAALLEVQYEVLTAAKFSVVIVIAGVDGAGKGETVNELLEWMDPRHVQAHALGSASDEERERPPMWRFWRRLPPKGKIGVFFGSWYSAPILERVMDGRPRRELEASLSQIRRFEKMLADEGTLVLKFWFHLSKKAQKARLRALRSKNKTRWRVTKEEWEHFERYDEFRRVSEHALHATDLPEAPWHVIEGFDRGHRSIALGAALLAAMKRRLALSKTANGAAAPSPLVIPALDKPPIIAGLDLSKRIDRKEYEEELLRQQRRLALLTRRPKFARLTPTIVFEGTDAAGKGGAIRRVTRALDARIYEIVPVAAPSDEERAQPYLWRFWRRLERDGRILIFDRSWYGRTLVERVEGYCTEGDWMRAYGEINDFEEQLVDAGNVVIKLWLQTSKAEQLRRFREREKTPFKRFKITKEDWRNRSKWAEYERAASDMIERTSTEVAPWTMVEAEDKYYARIKVLKTICNAIEEAL